MQFQLAAFSAFVVACSIWILIIEDLAVARSIIKISPDSLLYYHQKMLVKSLFMLTIECCLYVLCDFAAQAVIEVRGV
jgi:hypothetical protein